MILWTIQPRSIWNLIQETDVYICDPAKASMPEFSEQYQWLAERMAERVGPPPPGVQYPVWAWYMQKGKRAKPDLRSERWGNGPGDEDYCCMEIELPDNHVLLSDFDAWSIILLKGLLSETREEDTKLNMEFDSLSPVQQQRFQKENWKRAFDITPLDTSWMTRGKWVQATF